MKLSIVATLYQSEQYINEFCERARATAIELVGEDYEIILVNDGSQDSSLDEAIKICDRDHHIIVVDLSRNFGHHKAMMTGLAHAKGEKVFLIDSDLEEEPEWLLKFDFEMSKKKCDVVYGVQESRRGKWFERWSGEIYYLIFNWLIDIDHPYNLTTARLMSQRYVKALLQFQEREMVISGLWALTGFMQIPLSVKKHSSSPTTYSFSKKIDNAIRAVTSFSDKPLRMIFYTGLLFFGCSLIYAVYLISRQLFWGNTISGWSSVMVSIWLLGGLLILFVGIVGMYLSKIYYETKHRPNTIIRDIYQKSGTE